MVTFKHRSLGCRHFFPSSHGLVQVRRADKGFGQKIISGQNIAVEQRNPKTVSILTGYGSCGIGHDMDMSRNLLENEIFNPIFVILIRPANNMAQGIDLFL